ncbi:hypothetical protein [Arthrobacter sp. NPDC056727]|uniref:hypothetical protein n=1 Tax=Arthrobacter sp. NPDC056727 TaxID=3345927 RepID=UPI00366CEDA9
MTGSAGMVVTPGTSSTQSGVQVTFASTLAAGTAAPEEGNGPKVTGPHASGAAYFCRAGRALNVPTSI